MDKNANFMAKVKGLVSRKPGFHMIPEQHHRKLQGLLAHARTNTGPERDNAVRILAKRLEPHGIKDVDAFIKHAAFMRGMMAAMEKTAANPGMVGGKMKPAGWWKGRGRLSTEGEHGLAAAGAALKRRADFWPGGRPAEMALSNPRAARGALRDKKNFTIRYDSGEIAPLRAKTRRRLQEAARHELKRETGR